jgi:hypothetical protein
LVNLLKKSINYVDIKYIFSHIYNIMKGYEQITNPYTGRKVSVYGKIGQSILNEYVDHSQSGGDATPHMGVDGNRGSNCTITDKMRASNTRVSADRRGGPSPAGDGMESHVGIELVALIAACVRPKSTGTKAQRNEGWEKGDPMGPFFPDELNSQKMACALQGSISCGEMNARAKTVNKTNDQIQFVATAGAGQLAPGADDPNGVSANQKLYFEDALRVGDGSGLIHFKGLKLLFRGQLFDFIMRDNLITFQIEKPNGGGTKSSCVSRVGRRLDGGISYSIKKNGSLSLDKVKLERSSCWMPKLQSSNPLSQASIGSKNFNSFVDEIDGPQ